MSITYIPPRVPSVEGFLKEDGTVPLTGVWDTGNYNIKGPSAIYTSSTAPSAPYKNMLWNDTSIATRIMIRRWSGSAWQVVYGYETASRTVSLVHDHGALLTTTTIRDSAWNTIGAFGALYVMVTIEIEDKTLKSFINAVAVDAGSGKVKLPLASGHGFVAGERVCIDGTTNYDGVYIIDSVEDGYIVIPATYVAETILNTAIVRVVIPAYGNTFGTNYNQITLKAKGFSSERTQNRSVVFFSIGNHSCFYIRNWALKGLVQGIKFVSPGGSTGDGIYIMDSSKVDVEYCAFYNCYNGVVCVTYSSVTAAMNSFHSCSFASIVSSVSATVISRENKSFSDGQYGLFADWGGTIKKVGAQQPTGTVANEYAATSNAGQII
jgi:hypothetical protein